MNTATIPAPATVPQLDQADRPPARPDRAVRFAGLAGLIWFALLIATNILNGSVSPTADANVDDVITHLVDDRAIIITVTAAFVGGVPS
jgi:hypothetical protein